jgi:hypothetical protein
MDPRENQEAVPVMCWYNALFLYEADKAKVDPEKKIKEVYDQFREQYKVPENFPLRNFGLTMMLAYGLLVYPKEFLENKICWQRFGFKTKKCFEFVVDKTGAQNKTTQFVIGMRNAIAHANVRYLAGVPLDCKDGCEFWSVDLCTKSVNFKVKTSEKCFLEFLTEIGHFVINDIILPGYRQDIDRA